MVSVTEETPYPKRLSRCHDGDDAHDDESRTFSWGSLIRQGLVAVHPALCNTEIRQSSQLNAGFSPDQSPSAIRSIRRSVACASPMAVCLAPGSFWLL